MRWLGIAVLLCGLSSCSKTDENGSRSAKSESSLDGAQKSQTPSRPRHDDYPKDVPDPLFAEIVEVKPVADSVTVRLKTDKKNVIETGRWFVDRLKKAGWKQQSPAVIDVNTAWIVVRKNDRKCTVTVTPGSSEAAVRILVIVREK